MRSKIIFPALMALFMVAACSNDKNDSKNRNNSPDASAQEPGAGDTLSVTEPRGTRGADLLTYTFFEEGTVAAVDLYNFMENAIQGTDGFTMKNGQHMACKERKDGSSRLMSCWFRMDSETGEILALQADASSRRRSAGSSVVQVEVVGESASQLYALLESEEVQEEGFLYKSSERFQCMVAPNTVTSCTFAVDSNGYILTANELAQEGGTDALIVNRYRSLWFDTEGAE